MGDEWLSGSKLKVFKGSDHWKDKACDYCDESRNEVVGFLECLVHWRIAVHRRAG